MLLQHNAKHLDHVIRYTEVLKLTRYSAAQTILHDPHMYYAKPLRTKVDEFQQLLGYSTIDEHSCTIHKGWIDILKEMLSHSLSLYSTICDTQLALYKECRKQLSADAKLHLFRTRVFRHMLDSEIEIIDYTEGTLMRVIRTHYKGCYSRINIYRSRQMTIMNPIVFLLATGINILDTAIYTGNEAGCLKVSTPMKPFCVDENSVEYWKALETYGHILLK